MARRSLLFYFTCHSSLLRALRATKRATNIFMSSWKKQKANTLDAFNASELFDRIVAVLLMEKCFQPCFLKT